MPLFMDILIIAEKKKIADPFVDAINAKGHTAKYTRISKLILVSKKNETLIKVKDHELPQYDAVFLQVRSTLAPFVEPLLEELEETGYYTTAKRGSYYIAMNEPYQFVNLALNGVPSPKTITSGSAKNIEKVSKKISYPLITKSFIGKNAQQALIVENSKELNAFISSIKAEVDGFMLRQFIEEDIISCAVIGKKVFAIKRKYKDATLEEIKSGKTYRLSESEEKTAIKAVEASQLDIARVDLCKGKVVKIDPLVPWNDFDNICSENIEDFVADYLIEKAAQHEHKIKLKYDLFGLRKIFKNTIFGRVLK
jgi:glutathione synthase/RimK-type ligase-like ATP-grasp enzyme